MINEIVWREIDGDLEFGKEKAREITKYNSVSAFYSKLMKTESPTNIV